MPFPRSMSKPPSAAPSETDDQPDDEMAGPTESVYGSAEASPKEMGKDVIGMVIDQTGAFSPSPNEPQSRGRSSRRTSRNGRLDIDRDRPVESPFSAASSSIPSSSRSSIRGGRQPRARASSMNSPTTREQAESMQAGEDVPTKDEINHHDHHHYSTLRHFVGGIFRGKHRSASEERKKSHTILPSKPIRPQTNNGRPVVTTAPEPSDRPPEGVKAVTPKIRTRDERSMDPMYGDRGLPQAGVVGDRETRARLE